MVINTQIRVNILHAYVTDRKHTFATTTFTFLSNFQLLLKRVTLEGSDVGEWQKDLLTWSQLSHAHILQYVDAWVTDDNIQHVLCENARMCLSVCLRNMAPSKPCRRLYPCWLFHIVSALEVSPLWHPAFHEGHFVQCSCSTLIISASTKDESGIAPGIPCRTLCPV